MFDPEAIVLYSKGIPYYLVSCVFEAKASNPDTPIYVISDENPLISFVRWVDSRDFSGAYDRFAGVYEHLSSNEDWFERICFYRWFVILEWMKKNGIRRVVHLDTDILLICGLDQVNLPLSPGMLAIGSRLGGSFSGHCAIIDGTEALAEFCDFCCRMYEEPDRLEVLRNFYKQKQERKLAGGVCDMYAFGWATGWRGSCQQFVKNLELNEPEEIGYAFDMSLENDRTASRVEYWVLENGLKKIAVDDQGRKCFLTVMGQLIPIATIHCQGDSKKWMRQLMTRRSAQFYLAWLPRKVRCVLRAQRAAVLDRFWRLCRIPFRIVRGIRRSFR